MPDVGQARTITCVIVKKLHLRRSATCDLSWLSILSCMILTLEHIALMRWAVHVAGAEPVLAL